MRRAFMEHAARGLGDAAFRTPRMTIKAFLDLLSVLEQNPGADWRTLLPEVRVAPDPGPEHETHEARGDARDDDMEGFRL
jgi:hypothetical protein